MNEYSEDTFIVPVLVDDGQSFCSKLVWKNEEDASGVTSVTSSASNEKGSTNNLLAQKLSIHSNDTFPINFGEESNFLLSKNIKDVSKLNVIEKKDYDVERTTTPMLNLLRADSKNSFSTDLDNTNVLLSEENDFMKKKTLMSTPYPDQEDTNVIELKRHIYRKDSFSSELTEPTIDKTNQSAPSTTKLLSTKFSVPKPTFTYFILFLSIMVNFRLTLNLKSSRTSDLERKIELDNTKELLQSYRSKQGWVKDAIKEDDLFQIDTCWFEASVSMGPCMKTKFEYAKETYEQLKNQLSGILSSNTNYGNLYYSLYTNAWLSEESSTLPQPTNRSTDELETLEFVQESNSSIVFQNDTYQSSKRKCSSIEESLPIFSEKMRITMGLKSETFFHSSYCFFTTINSAIYLLQEQLFFNFVQRNLRKFEGTVS